jgi:hypothetical protein
MFSPQFVSGQVMQQSAEMMEMAEFKDAKRRNPSNNAAVETALSDIIRHEQPLLISFAPVDSNGFHRSAPCLSK